MKMKENIIVDKVDRISHLPESIIHHIISFFISSKTIAQMSVLSKHWFALIAYFPVLKFSSSYSAFRNKRDMFFKYVLNTTTRFCEKNVGLRKFSICTHPMEPTQVDILDECLGLIFKKGLQELVIEIDHTYFIEDPPVYCLPNILLSASSLTSLTIVDCKLPSTFTVDVVKLKSLKMLSLCRVPIDEGMITCLETSCPLLEEIKLVYCKGIQIFRIGHQSLRKFQICCYDEIKEIYIEAPNLCCLIINGSRYRGAPLLNLASCTKLTTFHYYGFPLECFADLTSNFPVIENLFLHLPFDCNNLKLSSRSLKKLKLRPSLRSREPNSKFDLERIDIDTPNLLLFEYDWSVSSNRFLREYRNQPKAYIKYGSNNVVDILWFQKLRQFLEKNNIFKVLKLIFSPDLIDVERLTAIQNQFAPYELEHVELEPFCIFEIQNLLTFVDAILCCCRPRSLTLSFVDLSKDFKIRNQFVKYAYEKLLQQEDQGQIKVQIVPCYFSGSKQHFSNLNSFLEALPHDQLIDTITFIKEEIIQETR